MESGPLDLGDDILSDANWNQTAPTFPAAGRVPVGFGTPVAAPRKSLDPAVKRAVVWSIVGIGAVLILGFAGVLVMWLVPRGVPQVANTVSTANEPLWEPDPQLVAGLSPEFDTGDFAIRPAPMFDRHQIGGGGLNDPNYSQHIWMTQDYSFLMTISITKLRPLTYELDGPRDPTKLLNPAEKLMLLMQEKCRHPFVDAHQIDYGRVGQQRLVRLSYEFDTQSIASMSGDLYARYNRIWMCQDRRVVISIQAVSKEPFDSPNWQTIETSVRTLRIHPNAQPVGELPASQETPQAAQSHPWETWNSPRHGYSLEMPGKPEIVDRPALTPQGMVSYEFAQVIVGNSAFLASCNSVPDALLDGGADALLDSGIERSAGNIQGTIVSQQPIQYDGHPGRDVQIEGTSRQAGKLAIHMRIYVINGKLYGVSWNGPPGQEPEQDVQRFFNSFQIVARD